MDRLISYE